MEQKYVSRHVVACYEADANQNLKPTAMLDWMQEVAGQDASRLGFGYDELKDSGAAWVLSRTHVRFLNYPKWRDVVSLNTWHKGALRVLYLRDFLLTDDEGKTLVEATTSWLIIDTKSRRMIREPNLVANPETCVFENAIEQPADKIVVPLDVELDFCGSHKVVWSDIDTMGHVNNVRYVCWAFETIEQSMLQESVLKEILVNYEAEVLLGETVDFYSAWLSEEDATSCYVVGKICGKVVFSVKMRF